MKQKIEQTHQFLVNREMIEIKRNINRHKRAKRDLDKILKIIIEKYKPEKIYLWGSILTPNNFRDYSDIDIALVGILSAKRFFELYGEIMFLSDFSIDIVQLEKIEPEFRDIILMKGKIVYEKNE